MNRTLASLCAVTVILMGTTGPTRSAGIGDALSNLGGGGLPSVSGAGAENTAGVLSYCVKNNYLGGGSASEVLGALSGRGDTSQSSAFRSGESGQLETGGSETFSLAGVQNQVKTRVCDLVLEHGRSFL